MPGKTKNQLLAEIREVMETTVEYKRLEPGVARGMLRTAHLGLRAIEAELAAGERERDTVKRCKDKRRRLSTGAEVPLWGDQ